jgi:hypothetical protein
LGEVRQKCPYPLRFIEAQDLGRNLAAGNADVALNKLYMVEESETFE